MTRTFQTHFLAGVMAFAVALSGLSATPARADSDTAAIITGLGALAIIGGAIAHNNDRRHGVTRHGYSNGYRHHRGYGYGRHGGYRYKRHGYGYKRHGYGYNRHGYGYKRHYRHNRHNRHYNRGYGYGHHR